jgi:hypothetical protein
MIVRVLEIELHDEIVTWMHALDDTAWHRTDRLATLGPAARMPLSRSLGDGLFELRFTARRVLAACAQLNP